jgi:hypothetical protein
MADSPMLNCNTIIIIIIIIKRVWPAAGTTHSLRTTVQRFSALDLPVLLTVTTHVQPHCILLLHQLSKVQANNLQNDAAKLKNTTIQECS